MNVDTFARLAGATTGNVFKWRNLTSTSTAPCFIPQPACQSCGCTHDKYSHHNQDCVYDVLLFTVDPVVWGISSVNIRPSLTNNKSTVSWRTALFFFSPLPHSTRRHSTVQYTVRNSSSKEEYHILCTVQCTVYHHLLR